MLMSFLKCNPNIFVINDEYEILIFLKEKGICFIEVAGQYFYEENSGVLSSEKNYVKIRVPQQQLDSNESYKVIESDNKTYLAVPFSTFISTISFSNVSF